MYYDNYYFWGMHFFWWFLWIVMLFWIFVVPYDIPGQKSSKILPIDVLKKRLATGLITEAEYEQKKKIIEAK